MYFKNPKSVEQAQKPLIRKTLSKSFRMRILQLRGNARPSVMSEEMR